MVSRFRPGRRTRGVASWLPAVLVVPLGMAALVGVSEQKDTAEEAMRQVHPLDPGTTWVYRVTDHGEPSGSRVRQVLGPIQIFRDGLREGVTISSVYDDYPGQGPQVTQAYVGVDGRDLLQFSLIARGRQFTVDPPIPAYKLPPEVGTSWKYDGVVGLDPLKATAEVTAVGDVEVGGRTFDNCTEWTSSVEVADAPEGVSRELLEWTCPGIGVVRSTDTYAPDDVDITEELVEFHGVQDDWVADTAPDEEPPSKMSAGESTSAGFDEGRSHAVPDGSLSSELAWTDSRDAAPGFSPVSNDEISVVGDSDGVVSARGLDKGDLRWQVSLPEPIVAPPAMARDMVLVADGEKNLWALSTADGSARWVHHFDDVVSMAPAVGEDVVAVAVDNRTVSALRPEDGTELWSADLGGQARTPPAVSGDRLVVGDNSATLTAFDLATGDEVWTSSLQDSLEAGPTISGDHVLAVDGNALISSFDPEDGSVQWQADAHAFPSEPLAAGSGHVVSLEVGGHIEAFDLDDGERLWRRQADDVDVAPAIVGDQAALVSVSGAVSLLDLADGSVADRWRLPAPAPGARIQVQTPIGVVADNLVVTADVDSADFNSTTYAYRLDGDGPEGVAFAAEAVHVFGLPIAAAPMLDGRDLYALGSDGVVYRSTPGQMPRKVVGGVLPAYGFDVADGVVVVPRKEEVWGVDADGTKLWELPATEPNPGSLPVIAGDVAFVPLHGAGLAALDLRSGQPKWASPLAGSTGTSSPVPLRGGDVAYAANGLARFEGGTGAELWRLGGDLANAVAYGSISEDAGVIYASLVSPDPSAPAGERIRAVAVDAATGQVLWQRDMDGAPFYSGTVAAEGAVVITDGTNTVSVLDGATGKVKWSYPMGTAPGGLPVVHDGVVLLTQRGRQENLLHRDFRVTAHDLDTGAFLGAYEPPRADDSFLPTVSSGPDGQVLVPTTDAIGGNVAVLEAAGD